MRRASRIAVERRHATHDLGLKSPFYAQTLDFTDGPCALLMKALDECAVLDRTALISAYFVGEVGNETGVRTRPWLGARA
jgi:hypothetical protein